MKRFLSVIIAIGGLLVCVVACASTENKVEKKLTKVLEESGKTITMCKLTAGENNTYEGYVECQVTEQQAREIFKSVPRLSLTFAEEDCLNWVGVKICTHVKVVYDGKKVVIIEQDITPESAELLFNILWGN